MRATALPSLVVMTTPIAVSVVGDAHAAGQQGQRGGQPVSRSERASPIARCGRYEGQLFHTGGTAKGSIVNAALTDVLLDVRIATQVAPISVFAQVSEALPSPINRQRGMLAP